MPGTTHRGLRMTREGTPGPGAHRSEPDAEEPGGERERSGGPGDGEMDSPAVTTERLPLDSQRDGESHLTLKEPQYVEPQREEPGAGWVEGVETLRSEPFPVLSPS